MDNKQYLRGALALLERSHRKNQQPELKTEIMVSIVECIGQASGEVEHSVELENQLELELDRIITDTDTPVDDQEDDEKNHEHLLSNNRTDNWYSRAIKALKYIPTNLSKEDAELLKKMRQEFDCLGKDIAAFDKAMNAGRAIGCDIGTQTEKKTVTTTYVQTHEHPAQTLQDANVQTDPFTMQDTQQQTDVTKGPAIDQQTQYDIQLEELSLGGG